MAHRFAVERLGGGLFKVVHVTSGSATTTRRRARGARARTQARAAGAQPRPRARLLLRLADHDDSDRRAGDAPWRKTLFVAMARNATSPIEHFGLPEERTVIVGSQVARLSARAECERPRAGCRHRRAKRGKSGAASRIFHGMSRWRAGCGKSKRARRIFHGLHGVFAIQWAWRARLTGQRTAPRRVSGSVLAPTAAPPRRRSVPRGRG